MTSGSASRRRDAGPVGDESHKERLDREVIELLNELRVALPGVQVLFAFLLIVPFQGGFAQVTVLERGLYFAAFAATTVASLLLIAPATYHRIQFRQRDKEQMLQTANRFVLGGTALLGVAITATAFLITDLLFGDTAGAVTAVAIALAAAWFWFGLPLLRRASGNAEGVPPSLDSNRR